MGRGIWNRLIDLNSAREPIAITGADYYIQSFETIL